MNEILSQSIFFGIAITLVTYEIGLWIKQKTGKAIANPLLISVILIVAVLLLFHIDYETYANGAQYISIFLTPATVSLAVPLYRQLELLKTYILEKKDIRSNETIAKHADWTESFLPSYPEINAENVTHILEQEVGKVFCQVLEDAGVYKCTPEGREAFMRFIESL